ncbi:MAG: hypothetical protein ACUVR0_11970 [Candidatus Aminicenantales bacterium]
MAVDSSGCIPYEYGARRLTALVGLKDIIVVDTKDARLIYRKDQDQRVRDIFGVKPR